MPLRHHLEVMLGPRSVFRPPLTSVCRRCRRAIPPTSTSTSFLTLASAANPSQRPRRPFSTTPARRSDEYKEFSESLQSGGLVGKALSKPKTQEQALREIQQQKQREAAQAKRQRFRIADTRGMSQEFMEAKKSAEVGMANRPATSDAFGELHHLHVYTTKRNTHITLTRPNREPMLSLSTGNINFKKAQRGGFDAAYQLVTYSIAQIVEKGFMPKIRQLEIIMRGYGPGREAFQKVLLGSEGRLLKSLVARVTDGTRLKFGGTRSSSVRRL